MTNEIVHIGAFFSFVATT